jgi:hypothetical protein
VLIGLLAAVLVVLAVSFGILSTRASAPTPTASLGQPTGRIDGRGISLSVSTTTEPVDVSVEVDSQRAVDFRLLPGESRSFLADVSLTVRVSPGGTADVVVNGEDKGSPGRPSRPWSHTYSYETPTASAAGA